MRKTQHEANEKFASYVSVYNNLDNLIWRLPGVLSASVAVFLLLLTAILRSENATLPPPMWSLIFVLFSLLFGLGAYSILRLRQHHTLLGRELTRLEDHGYFHKRGTTLGFYGLPSAPHLFVIVFFFFSISCATFAVLSAVHAQFIIDLLGSKFQTPAAS